MNWLFFFAALFVTSSGTFFLPGAIEQRNIKQIAVAVTLVVMLCVITRVNYFWEYQAPILTGVLIGLFAGILIGGLCRTMGIFFKK